MRIHYTPVFEEIFEAEMMVQSSEEGTVQKTRLEEREQLKESVVLLQVKWHWIHLHQLPESEAKLIQKKT